MRFIIRHNDRAIFRIIPHKSAENSGTRRFMYSLYELFSVRPKEQRWPWEHREGWHVALRPAPDIWWVTRMWCEQDGEEERRRIEYYVSIPAAFAEAFEQRFYSFPQWSGCTLEEIPANEFTFPDPEHTDLHRLKYRRHNVFSLDHNYSEQTEPVRSVMSISQELQPGDSLDIFIRTEAMKRTKWKALADYAWERWDKGGVPSRAGLDPARRLRQVYTGLATLFAGLIKFFQDIGNAGYKTFFHTGGESAFDTSKVEALVMDPDRAELEGSLDRSRKKRSLPIYKTSITYAVHAEDPIRREMIGKSVAAAYGVLNGANSLQQVKLTIKPAKQIELLREWRVFDLDQTLMSTDEVGKINQLPTAELQREFHEELESNQRVEVEIPAAFRDETGILAGTATDHGETHEVRIPLDPKMPDFTFRPRVFMGAPRMGKDMAIVNLVVEAKRKHGIGAVIPDVIDEREGHRGMADALRDHLDPDDVLDFNLGDTDNPIYLGLLDIVKNVPDLRIAADRISEEVADFLLDDADDDKYQTADFTKAAAKATMGDFIGMKLMLLSEAYRKQKIEELQDVFDMDIWRDYDDMGKRGTGGKQQQIAGPIMRRLGQIINSEFLAPILCQEKNPLMDLYGAIEQGKVIVFRIPSGSGAVSERAVQILVYWIALNVFFIRKSLGRSGAGTMLVLNEPHQFLSDGLVKFVKKMFYEGPKYLMAPVLAFHDFAAFDGYPKFVDSLMAAMPNWHLFKPANDRALDRLMHILSDTFEDREAAFKAVKEYQFIACWTNRGSYERPFVCDALPLVWKRYKTQDNSFLTKKHSRQYGRPIGEVLEEIRQKNKMVYQKSTA